MTARGEAKVARIAPRILEQLPVAVVVTDTAGAIVSVNAAFERRTGYRADEVLGQTLRVLDGRLTDPAVHDELWRTIHTGQVWQGEVINRHKEGEPVLEREIITPIVDDSGRITQLVAIREDVTRPHSRAQTEGHLRMLRMLSDCKRVLVRSSSQQQLFDDLCSVLRDQGGYEYVWIGVADDPRAERVSVVSHSGDRAGLVEQMTDTERSAGIGGEAIRQQQPIVRSRLCAVGDLSCVERAWAHGYRSTAALPFAVADQGLRGVLRLYSAAEAAFDETELALLQELTEDLCFGLSAHHTRRSLEESEGRFRCLAEDAVAGIYMIQQGRFVYVNPPLAKTLGYAPEQMTGMAVTEVVAPADRDRVVENLRRRIDAEVDSVHYEFSALRADSEIIHVEVYGARTYYRGRPAVVGSLLDVTARYQAEARDRMLSRAVDAASSGIAISDLRDADKPFIYVNRAFERITGYPAEEAIGRNGRFLLGDDLDQPELEKVRNALSNHDTVETVLRSYDRDGRMFWNQFSMAPVGDERGNATHYVSVIDDISTQKEYQQRLEQLSHYDGLTGLANKSLLKDRIEQGVIQCRGSGRAMALVLLDLDGFRMVHQSLALEDSDGVLQAVGRRIHALAGPIDTVARLEADEFAWLMRNAVDENRVAHRVQELMEAVAQSLSVGSETLTLTASAGIGLYPRDGGDAEQLMANAEAALFQAMRQRNGFRFYTPAMNAQTRERLALELDLKRAWEQGELELHYQPKVDVRSGRITGAEALMRWRHPSRGMIPPDQFIPLAEEIGLIESMGKWALEEASHRTAELNRVFGGGLSVAVNLSARQFADASLAGHVEAVLQRSGLPPQHLECELTESMLMDDPESARELLSELRAREVRIALDDFGTGFSSLSYLKRFPIDILKIDRSFVSDIPGDEHDTAIARAIIALARALRLSVVAEGVETAEQHAFLDSEGCQAMQGYLFSKPLPLEDYRALLASAGAVAPR